jgi:hypothetical protein
MDDSDQHRVLFIKQKCFFKDYIIEFFDKDNNLLKEEEIEINEEKSQYFLMNLDLDIKEIKGMGIYTKHQNKRTYKNKTKKYLKRKFGKRFTK